MKDGASICSQGPKERNPKKLGLDKLKNIQYYVEEKEKVKEQEQEEDERDKKERRRRRRRRKQKEKERGWARQKGLVGAPHGGEELELADGHGRHDLANVATAKDDSLMNRSSKNKRLDTIKS